VTVEKHIKAIGMRIFIKYYDFFKRGTDVINKLEDEGFTLKSCRSRQSKARKVFREDLQIQALEMVVNAKKVDTETRINAEVLLKEEYKS